MTDPIAYVLFCRPRGEAIIRDFFDPYGELFTLLVRPPETRNGSFGMRMAVQPRLEDAEYWELHGRDAFSGRTRRLRIYADGTTIFRAPADESFLCWPHQLEYFFVNPVVVADSAVTFCRLWYEVLELMSRKPDSVELGVELRNAGSAEPPIKLYEGPLRPQSGVSPPTSRELHGVGEKSPRRTSTSDVSEFMPRTNDSKYSGADAVAYSLVKQCYDIFGLDETTIPYVARDLGRPRIAVEAFGGAR
jgi:hypothetical protein